MRQISALFRADWDRLPVALHDANLLISPSNARHKLLTMIAAARRELDVYEEEIADSGVERALIGAHKRRVRVRFLLAWGASPKDALLLARSGVEVRELRSPYVHAKLVEVDGREAFVGSENLSAISLDRNRELGVLIRGPQLARMVQTFDADWQRAVPLSPG